LTFTGDRHVTFNKQGKITLLLAAALLMVAAFISFTAVGSDTANAGPSAPSKITTVSAEQTSAFSALGRPATTDLPPAVRIWASSESTKNYALNADLARAVAPPEGATDEAWYLIPGNGVVCLLVGSAATCQTTEKAASSGLVMQFIPPNVNSVRSPLPPPGEQVNSTILGVAPAGVTTIEALTAAGGGPARTPTVDGAYRLTGSDIQQLSLKSARGSSSAAVFHYE
jgi:hypothetical protein